TMDNKQSARSVRRAAHKRFASMLDEIAALPSDSLHGEEEADNGQGSANEEAAYTLSAEGEAGQEHNLQLEEEWAIEDEFAPEETDDDSEAEMDGPTIEQSLAEWALKFRVSAAALDSLLHLLHRAFPQLPLSARTLLQTPRKTATAPLSSGEFVYLGIRSNLPKDTQLEAPLKLSIGIDGLPIFKSKNEGFWPILGSFPQSCPFVIALFFGVNKPEVCGFLKDLVAELQDLKDQVVLEKVIADRPARALIKCIKGHSGYSSCDKCTIHGEYHQQVVFDELNCPSRTDASFREKHDPNHHIGDHPSPFEELPIDMVHAFPYDYMHLVLLGVMRRLFLYWIQGPLATRFGHRLVDCLSENLCSLRNYFPTEFARKPRSLSCLKFWKATEFRSFLLYSGVTVMNNTRGISRRILKNFLLLHSAIFILCDHLSNVVLIQYASQLLNHFISDCKTTYGSHMLVYNVHSLSHLANDCLRYGCLDNFSAFTFENFMQTLKKCVRGSRLPLIQCVNRIRELAVYEARVEALCTEAVVFKFLLADAHLPIGVSRFSCCIINGIRFSSNINDCHFFDREYCCYQICHFLTSGSSYEVVCKRYKKYSSAYDYPFDSRKIHVYCVSGLSSKLLTVPLSRMFRKACILPYQQTQYAYPLFATLWK
ncbi:hypothetical protein BOX15_Mlig006167g1, partial [Macrostomum lignano]